MAAALVHKAHGHHKRRPVGRVGASSRQRRRCRQPPTPSAQQAPTGSRRRPAVDRGRRAEAEGAWAVHLSICPSSGHRLSCPSDSKRGAPRHAAATPSSPFHVRLDHASALTSMDELRINPPRSIHIDRSRQTTSGRLACSTEGSRPHAATGPHIVAGIDRLWGPSTGGRKA